MFSMKYVLKDLKSTLTITSIANVHFFEFPSEFYTQMDKHPFYELVYVSNGRLIVNSEDYSGTLEKHQMIIHGSDRYHSLQCKTSLTPTVIIVGFTCTGINIDEFSKKPILLDENSIKKLAEIVTEGRNVFAPPYNVPKYDMKKKKNIPIGSEQLLKNLLEYFLLTLIRKTNKKSNYTENKELDKLNYFEVVSYIEDNYLEKITLDELAFIFRTNRSTLCKNFKAQTGKTISQFIIEKKLEVAKELIKTTDKSLTEISEQLNFESIHYFTKFFKKHVGLSPSVFRKTN